MSNHERQSADTSAEYNAELAAFSGAWKLLNQADVTDNGIATEAHRNFEELYFGKDGSGHETEAAYQDYETDTEELEADIRSMQGDTRAVERSHS